MAPFKSLNQTWFSISSYIFDGTAALLFNMQYNTPYI